MRLLFALAAVLALGACNDKKADEKKSDATASDLTEVRTVECVASGDVVYIDPDYMMASSAIYAKEGKDLEQKLEEFKTKAASTQESWAKKEQSIAAEMTKLQNDAAKLNEDYQKGLITTLNAQQKGEELASKEQSIQSRYNSLQSSAQKEAEKLAKEEQDLMEAQMVLMNKFQDLTRRAIAEINADRRYKMILNAVSVIDADPTLNISDLVLKKVDELYAADNQE